MDLEHVFDSGIALQPLGPGRMRGRTVPQWANMVGPFGGMTAATLLHAIELQPDCHGRPIALTVNYAAPVADGEFDIELRLARTNRSSQHWIVELVQDGETRTTATAVFGLRRDTWSDTEAVAPAAPRPEDARDVRFPSFVVWPRNYEMRYTEGPLPDADDQPSASSTTTLWVRDNPPRPLDFPALTAMCDIFFPRTYLRQGKAGRAGTISLTIYFHADDEQLAGQGDGYLLATAHADRFARGYSDQHAKIFGHDGTLLATTSQIVYFKD